MFLSEFLRCAKDPNHYAESKLFISDPNLNLSVWMTLHYYLGWLHPNIAPFSRAPSKYCPLQPGSVQILPPSAGLRPNIAPFSRQRQICFWLFQSSLSCDSEVWQPPLTAHQRPPAQRHHAPHQDHPIWSGNTHALFLSCVVDPDPNWIRIQELSGYRSVFQIWIRIHTGYK